MTRWGFWISAAVLLLGLVTANGALGEERFPPPDFTDHQLPPTVVPGLDRPEVMQYVDLGMLVFTLSVASYLALRRRSRRGLAGLAVFSLLYFGFLRGGCVCSIGAIQNVTLAVFDSTYAIPLVVVGFFVVPLVFTLFFGRTFCAAVCPLGAVQEMVTLRPVKLPAWLQHTLGLLAYVYLGLAVMFAATGAGFVICRYDPFVGFFRLGGSINMLIVGGCFLIAGAFVARPYCRFLCPYGVVLGWLSKFSKWHVSITPTDCIQCRLCEDACPYGAIQTPTVDQAPDERRRGRRRLATLLLVLPVLVAVGAVLGVQLKVPLSKMHPTVRLADRIASEEAREVEDTTDASDAFRNTGQTIELLYEQAAAKVDQFALAGGWFGAWMGLVVGLKMIHLSLRRRRVDYLADRADCVSCGRCFWYCPQEHVRLGLIDDPEEMISQTTTRIAQ